MSTEPHFTRVDPDLYDALINWPRRLAFETPLLRELISGAGARRVLDAACGTGRHAALLHGWGLEVQGADASEVMIERCRALHGLPPGLTWVLRPFDIGPDTSNEAAFDLVICVGNSLSLAGDEAAVSRSIDAMARWLRPGGALLVQVLNLFAIPPGETRWQKWVRATCDATPHFLMKGLHRSGDRGYIDLIDVPGGQDLAPPLPHQAEFMGIRAEILIDAARRTGLGEAKLYGSYTREAFDVSRSTDLILVASKPPTSDGG